LLVGCEATPRFDWHEQLAPSGACWDVNLADGVEEESNNELHALFDCLNQSGSIEPLAGLDSAWDATTRNGNTVGADLAATVNALPIFGIQMLGWAHDLLELYQDEDIPFDMTLQLLVESLYGTSYTIIEQDLNLLAASNLDNGLVRPLLPVVQLTASNLLDDGIEPLHVIADGMNDEAMTQSICLVVGMHDSSTAEVSELSDSLLWDLGQAIDNTQDSSNDMWADASGDSFRDLAEALFVNTGSDGQTFFPTIQPFVTAILDDDTLSHRMERHIEDNFDAGHLAQFPLQLRYLTNIDADGEMLAEGQTSALATLIRLLSAGNQEIDCSLDLWITNLEFSLGNLSVAILEALAEQDPDSVASGVELLGGIVDGALTQAILLEVADSGVCPAITSQMVEDLRVIDRLSDTELGDFTTVLIDFLGAFSDSGGDDHIADLVDILDAAHIEDLVAPVEELLRDIGNTHIAQDIVQVLDLLTDDDAALNTGRCPEGTAPLDFAGLWSILRDVLSDGDGEAALSQIDPILTTVVAQPGSWEVLHNLGQWLQTDGSTVHSTFELLAQWTVADVEIEMSATFAEIVTDENLVHPALRITENDTFIDALMAAELTNEGPIPFLARLIVGDTLASLLLTIDLLVGASQANDG